MLTERQIRGNRVREEGEGEEEKERAPAIDKLLDACNAPFLGRIGFLTLVGCNRRVPDNGTYNYFLANYRI